MLRVRSDALRRPSPKRFHVIRAGTCFPARVLSLPDVDFEVVECGDAGDGMIDRLASASAWAEDLVVFESGGWVGRAARCLSWQILFRAASRRTGRDGFPIIRLSSDYSVSGWAARAGHTAPFRRSAFRIPPGSGVRVTWPPSPCGRL